MKTVTYLLLGTAAIALAGCNSLPGSSLGATFGAERYLEADHGGPGFTGHWRTNTPSSDGAPPSGTCAGGTRRPISPRRSRPSPASSLLPGRPEQLGVDGDAAAHVPGRRRDDQREQGRPARGLRSRPGHVGPVSRGAACRRGRGDLPSAGRRQGAARRGARGLPRRLGVELRRVFRLRPHEPDRSARARPSTRSSMAVQSMGATALSVVGHTDTVGSVQYNQGLSERRARRVGEGLVAARHPVRAR